MDLARKFLGYLTEKNCIMFLTSKSNEARQECKVRRSKDIGDGREKR